MKYNIHNTKTILAIMFCKFCLTELTGHSRQHLGITDLTTEAAIPLGTTIVFYLGNDITRIPYGFFNVSTITGECWLSCIIYIRQL